MRVEPANITAKAVESIPTVIAARVHCGLEPEYAIQYFSRDAKDWRIWDCAYTRIQADNLLDFYDRRHRAEGYEWRIAKIVYN